MRYEYIIYKHLGVEMIPNLGVVLVVDLPTLIVVIYQGVIVELVLLVPEEIKILSTLLGVLLGVWNVRVLITGLLTVLIGRNQDKRHIMYKRVRRILKLINK